jgi:hypothetical protein
VAYLIYIVVKLAAYSSWCWLGLRLWRPGSATVLRAGAFGLLRLVIGVLAGATIFFLMPTSATHLLQKYIGIYVPVRLVEWFILALIVRRGSTQKTEGMFWWCVGGIAVSFVADLASPEGLAGHFCVGRCLC